MSDNKGSIADLNTHTKCGKWLRQHYMYFLIEDHLCTSDRHDITKILLKVAINSIKHPNPNPVFHL